MFRVFSRVALILIGGCLLLLLVSAQIGNRPGVQAAAFDLAPGTQFDVFIVYTWPEPPYNLTEKSVGGSGVVHEYFAAWSPDGELMAVNSQASGGLDVMERFNRHRRTVSNFCFDGVRWSPDGARILCVQSSQASTLIGLEDGVNQTMPPMLNAAWSPDSRRIVFAEYLNRAKTLLLKVYDVDSGTTRDVMMLSNLQSDLLWLDDARAAFIDVCEGQSALVIKNIDSEQTTCFPVTDLDDSAAPAWSPDRQRLAYPVKDGLNVMNVADGSVTFFPTFLVRSELTWSPDSGHIALATVERVRPKGQAAQRRFVFSVLDIAQGESRILLQEENSAIQRLTAVAWSPDGRLLTYTLVDLTGEFDAPGFIDLTTGEYRSFFEGWYANFRGGFGGWQPG